MATVAILAITKIVHYRNRLKGKSARYGTISIPEVPLEKFCTIFTPKIHGISLNAEVFFVSAGGSGVCGTTSDTEAWILAAMSKQAMCMFEFGTASGRTSYLWARNSGPSSKIHTLTLHPDQEHAYNNPSKEKEQADPSAINEITYNSFIYSDTEQAQKIKQHFGDSQKFDESQFLKKCDLLFIDGSHSYVFVKNDTEKALRMLKPGGFIIWHDYRNDVEHTQGVYRFLNELSHDIPIVQLKNTTLAGYQSPP